MRSRSAQSQYMKRYPNIGFKQPYKRPGWQTFLRFGLPAFSAYMLGKGKKAKVKASVKPKLHQNAVPGAGGTFSKFFYGTKRIPKGYASVVKGLAKNYQVYNGAARYSSAVGVQDVQTPLTMFNQTDVQALMANFAVTYKDAKALLMSCSAELLITNQDVGNCRITLYDIVARRDLSAANVDTPSDAWGHSYADQGGANNNQSNLGSTPFSAELFNQYYKVKKITHITLGQGQSHTHRVHYAPNRKIDGEYVQYAQYGFRGLTCFTMLVDHGFPYNDSTTKTQVSTGKTALDVVWRKQYKYTYITDNSNNYYITNSLPSTFGVGENVFDYGSGAAVAESSA